MGGPLLQSHILLPSPLEGFALFSFALCTFLCFSAQRCFSRCPQLTRAHISPSSNAQSHRGVGRKGKLLLLVTPPTVQILPCTFKWLHYPLNILGESVAYSLDTLFFFLPRHKNAGSILLHPQITVHIDGEVVTHVGILILLGAPCW